MVDRCSHSASSGGLSGHRGLSVVDKSCGCMFCDVRVTAPYLLVSGEKESRFFDLGKSTVIESFYRRAVGLGEAA